jgi:hypothetical protein
MRCIEQVVRSELAKDLKGLGVKQDSLWVWIKIPYMDGGYECRLSRNIDHHLENYSAYTVAELGEILPGEIREIVGKVPGNPYFLDCGKIDYEHTYYVRYIRHATGDVICIMRGSLYYAWKQRSGCTRRDVNKSYQIWVY